MLAWLKLTLAFSGGNRISPMIDYKNMQVYWDEDQSPATQLSVAKPITRLRLVGKHD